MRLILMLPIVALAACAKEPPVDPAKLKAPAKWLMVAPCELPEIPADEGNPATRAPYYATSRRCHARTADQVRGLQGYVQTVRRAR